MNRKDWIRRTESTTRDRRPRDEPAARKVYLEELSRADQLALVEELVETRSAELCRAYPNVIDVAFGYKWKRPKKGGRRRLVRIPCVIFVVKRKWSRASEEDEDEKLPTHLFAYWGVRGKRKRCAIPTDVDDASVHAGFKPQALGDQIIVKAKGEESVGTITCAVHRSVFGNRPFAMSCRHVFSMSKTFHPQDVLGASVDLVDSGANVGETVDVKGRLEDGPEPSHDAQIAMVRDVAALRQALGDINVFDWARSKEDVPDEYDVCVAGRRIGAKLRGFFQPSIDYGRLNARNVLHECLILSELNAPTQGGQSGSPLISRDSHKLLVGMHIAGKFENNVALGYAIPAWHLLDPERYGIPARAERWVPFNP